MGCNDFAMVHRESPAWTTTLAVAGPPAVAEASADVPPAAIMTSSKVTTESRKNTAARPREVRRIGWRAPDGRAERADEVAGTGRAARGSVVARAISVPFGEVSNVCSIERMCDL